MRMTAAVAPTSAAVLVCSATTSLAPAVIAASTTPASFPLVAPWLVASGQGTAILPVGLLLYLHVD